MARTYQTNIRWTSRIVPSPICTCPSINHLVIWEIAESILLTDISFAWNTARGVLGASAWFPNIIRWNTSIRIIALFKRIYCPEMEDSNREPRTARNFHKLHPELGFAVGQRTRTRKKGRKEHDPKNLELYDQVLPISNPLIKFPNPSSCFLGFLIIPFSS